jgi:nucleoside-diphosphate-sugar epimerase
MIPEDVQGINKLAGESFFRVYSKFYGFNVTSLRITNCFGENQLYNGNDIGLVGSFVKDIIWGRPIIVYDGNRKRSLIYVKDLADIVFKLSTLSLSGFNAFNLSGYELPIDEIAKKLIQITGKGSYDLMALPDSIKKIDGGKAKFNCNKIMSLLPGLSLTNLDEAFSQTYDYFRKRIDSKP